MSTSACHRVLIGKIRWRDCLVILVIIIWSRSAERLERENPMTGSLIIGLFWKATWGERPGNNYVGELPFDSIFSCVVRVPLMSIACLCQNVCSLHHQWGVSLWILFQSSHDTPSWHYKYKGVSLLVWNYRYIHDHVWNVGKEWP